MEIPEFPGLSYDHAEYVDPFPGKKGDELVKVECGYCHDGIYDAPTSVHWDNGKGDQNWCFRCNGAGYVWRKVSGQRRQARVDVNRLNEHRRNQAIWNHTAAERLAEHISKSWDEAHEIVRREEERLAGLTQGFVGAIGDRLKGLPGTIKLATSFEVGSYSGFGTEMKALVIITLDDGHEIKTTGTGGSLWGWESGDKVLVTGTVKDHGNYNGQDQTVIFRTKLIAA